VTNPDNASVGNSYDEMLDALFAFFLLFAFLVFLRDLRSSFVVNVFPTTFP